MLDDDIAAIKAQIALAKASSIAKQRKKLAKLILEVDDGKIWECAHLHAKFEAKIREKVEAEIRKEIEAECTAKIT